MNHSLRRTMIAIPMAAAITLTGTTGALATKASAEPITSAAGPAATAIGGGPELTEGTPEQIQAAFEAINKYRAAQGVAPVKYLSDTLEEPPPGYTASSGTGGAVAGDHLDHAGVEAAVFLIEGAGVELFADERWTHVGIHLEYSAERSVTTYGVSVYAYPADQSVPGTYASPKEAFADGVPPTAPAFADITPKSTFYKEMTWLAETGISRGWDQGDGTAVFKPHAPVLRDQMAAFLYRSAGSPEYTPPAVSPFTDVSTNHTFYKEIAWLAHSGISTGWVRGDGTAVYKPGTPVLRDQMAAFLYRLAGEPAYDAPATSPFADLNTRQGFYKEMAWLADNEISKGWTRDDGTAVYRPGNQILRDQMAAFLYRLAPQLEN